MSRVLKFRIWDKANKEYKILGATGLDARNGDIIDYYNEGNRLGGPEEYDVEQCTGLKDKNGKEIYEGDIVKTNSPDRANFNAGAIVMQQQMYLIINTPTYGDARLSHSEPLGYYCDMECEIVGNIHENPELIGGEE